MKISCIQCNECPSFLDVVFLLFLLLFCFFEEVEVLSACFDLCSPIMSTPLTVMLLGARSMVICCSSVLHVVLVVLEYIARGLLVTTLSVIGLSKLTDPEGFFSMTTPIPGSGGVLSGTFFKTVLGKVWILFCSCMGLFPVFLTSKISPTILNFGSWSSSL